MKIAILGRFFYSLQHIQKAKRMGLSIVYLGYEAEDRCIANECDRFEVVPFGDVEKALSICREEQVNGVFAHREVNSVIFAAEVAEHASVAHVRRFGA